MFFRKKRPPPQKTVREQLIDAWTPSTEDSIERMAITIAEALDVSKVGIYLRQQDWLTIEVAHLRQAIVSSETIKTGRRGDEVALPNFEYDLGSDELDYPLRLRFRPSMLKPHALASPFPGTLFVPLSIDQDMTGLLLVQRLPSTPENALNELAASAPLISKVVASELAMRTATSTINQVSRAADAQDTAVSATVSIQRLVEAVIAQGARAIGYQSALLAIRNDQVLTPRFGWNLPPSIDALTDIVGILVQLDDFDGQLFIGVPDPPALAKANLESVLAVPVDAEVSYVLALLAAESPGPATEASLATLEAYAEQLNVILKRETDFERFAVAYEDTLTMTVKALELAYPPMRGHHARVTTMATGIAAAHELSEASIKLIRTAAQWHDVGLLSDPNNALSAALEFQHPELGASMVSPLPEGMRIGQLIRRHHESYDGFGFPDGLSADALTSEDNILAAAEHIVERTTRSPIASAESLQQVEASMDAESGQRIAPEVAAAAAKYLKIVIDTPFGGGRCVEMKSCPDDLSSRCPAAKATTACWTLPSDERQCGRHGDDRCEDCFVYRTWGAQNRDERSQ
ncbi:MAG: HD domain-containing phosphohydrolase [Myxococcota bacterium]